MFLGIFLILPGNNPLPKSNIDWSLLLKYILFHNSINGLFAFTLLSDYNSVYAPIFVDNAESTNVFITTKSQVVKLVVTKDKELIFLNLK